MFICWLSSFPGKWNSAVICTLTNLDRPQLGHLVCFGPLYQMTTGLEELSQLEECVVDLILSAKQQISTQFITQEAGCIIRVSMGYRITRISKVWHRNKRKQETKINSPEVFSLFCVPLRFRPFSAMVECEKSATHFTQRYTKLHKEETRLQESWFPFVSVWLSYQFGNPG